jgi:hypothetical protein
VDWFRLGGPIFGASTKIKIAYYEAVTSMAKMRIPLAVDDTYTAQAGGLKESIFADLWGQNKKIVKMSDISSPMASAKTETPTP